MSLSTNSESPLILRAVINWIDHIQSTIQILICSDIFLWTGSGCFPYISNRIYTADICQQYMLVETADFGMIA